MIALHFDIETRSPVSLDATGAWHYAADPRTEVLCVGYAVDATEPRIWVPGEAVPPFAPCTQRSNGYGAGSSATRTAACAPANTANARKIERRMLGRTGAVKLWPAGPQLVVGEGIETVLAGAAHFTHDDKPLQPAWSLVSSEALSRLPVIAGVQRLIILVDNDKVGLMASRSCAMRWTGAGRTVVALTPEPKGADFNDLIMLDKRHA